MIYKQNNERSNLVQFYGHRLHPPITNHILCGLCDTVDHQATVALADRGRPQ
jgi:hypothetical protein